MSAKEGITQKGVGVTYSKNVQVRTQDRVSGHGDMQMSETKASFAKSQNDTKKA